MVDFTRWLTSSFCRILLIAAFLQSCPAYADEPVRGARADAHISKLINRDAPGAAVLVSQDGKIIFEKGYGLADVEHHTAITPETKFRIGSITKQFTAGAILKLQEQGKLKVTDPLSKFIPDFPRGSEVTLHHLLTHTSGIHSYTETKDFLKGVTNAITPEKLIQSIAKGRYDFDPGTKFLYDNSGYTLLAYIVQTVSGDAYAHFLKTNFFQPLGMSNTGIYDNAAPPKNAATGYSYTDDNFNLSVDWNMDWAFGAGGIYSTVGDLYKWNEALFNGQVLSAASFAAATTPGNVHEETNATTTGYGYGLMMTQMRGLKKISHTGGLNGFSSDLCRFTDPKITIVVLENSQAGKSGADVPALVRELTQDFVADKFAPPTPANTNVPASAFDALVGGYDYGKQLGILRVTREGKALFAQLPGQPKLRILPKNETEFFWQDENLDASIIFIKDENGKVTGAIHHQYGNTIDAPRVDDSKLIKVDPATYDALVGEYDYGNRQNILTVSRVKDHLFAQLTGQPKFEIFPKSKAEFFWTVVDAQVTFVKDSEGKVTKVIHHQNGRTFAAPRID